MEEDDSQAIRHQSRTIFGIALITFAVTVGGFVLIVIAALWFASSIGGS